ncbi:hypothetical protein [Luteimicrobium sp. DT211]|uniref:hypothetical protein n=1 Tax=Luteimicrobium sp. DT211 TaxID=3393412 RepID=UPI003CEB7001
MAFVQVKRASRAWAVALAAALAGTTALVSVPATATAADPVVAPTEGAVVAPSSAVRLTGGVGLTDDAVYGETAAGIVALPRDGSAIDWSPVTVDGAPLTGHLLSAEGDALLVADAGGKADTLVWRAHEGGWSSRVVATGTTLGRGGLYALLPAVPDTTGRGGGTWNVEDVATGSITSHYTAVFPNGGTVDGSTLWAASGYAGGLVRIDIATDAWSFVERGTGYGSHGLAVRDPWAVETDPNGVRFFIDARRSPVYKNWQLPDADQALDRLSVGERTIVGLRAATSAGAATVAVREIGGDRTERTFGPAAAGALDLDDTGSTLAYRDLDGLLRVVDLGWATPPATTAVDQDPPEVPILTLAPPAATTVTVYGPIPWDTSPTVFTPSGADRQESRFRVTSDGAVPGDWRTGPVTGRSSSMVEIRTTPHHTVCVEARNHDVAGNYSAWSQPVCGRVDEIAPRVTRVSGLASTTRAVKDRAVAKITYAATDNLKVASYDVRYKKAPRGSATYSAWVYPGSWQRTTATSRSVTATTSQRVCLSVRARDTAGNVSAWSSSHCTYADGTAPRMTTAATAQRYYAYKKAWDRTPDRWQQTTFTFAGRDDRSTLRYQVQDLYPVESLGWYPSVYRDGWTTRHSVSRAVVPGEEICFRVRAKDAVGNVGRWSGTHCSNVMGGMFYDSAGANFGKLSTSEFDKYGSYRTGDAVVGHAVRLHVKKYPKGGSFAVYIGKTRIGTVKATSSTSHWAYVTVKVRAHHRGVLQLKPLTKAVSYVHDYTVIY